MIQILPSETRLAEAGACRDLVHDLAVHLEGGLHVVEVAVAPAPEMQAFDGRLGAERRRLPRGDGDGIRLEMLQRRAVAVDERNGVDGRLRLTALIAHFGLRMQDGGALLYPDIGGIDIHAGGAQIAVEGERLVEPVRDMQPDVFRQAAVIGIEILVAPLVFHARGALGVVPVVVHAHGDYVGAWGDIGGQVEAEGHHAVLVLSDHLAVDVHVHALAGALEFDEDLLALRLLGQHEMLAVPHHRVGEVVDVHAEGFVFVESMGEGDFLPALVVE